MFVELHRDQKLFMLNIEHIVRFRVGSRKKVLESGVFSDKTEKISCTEIEITSLKSGTHSGESSSSKWIWVDETYDEVKRLVKGVSKN